MPPWAKGRSGERDIRNALRRNTLRGLESAARRRAGFGTPFAVAGIGVEFLTGAPVMAKVSNKIIGIDLGTTNSVVAIMEGSQPKCLINAHGSRLTPSVVAFTKKGERLVGQPARHQQVTNPQNTIYSIKRFMGRRHGEVHNEEKMVPYKVVGGEEELVQVESAGKTYAPQQISAYILADLKKTAEDYLGEEVKKAVVTVPAYFNDAQRKATKEAGEIAGMEVVRVLPEPTAAALAFGVQQKKSGTIAVFDLGGGTFDISILDVGDNVYKVMAINGDTHLGGDDFDQELINYVAEEFRKKEGIDVRRDPMALQRLKEACEHAKCELSGNMEAEINLPFISADASGPKHLQMSITRSKFEQLIAHLVERCRQPCIKCLADAKLSAGDVDEVLLVGGSTRVPMVQRLVKELFGKEGNKSINPDEAVALGAGVQGAIIAREEGAGDMIVVDVTPLSLGVETLGEVMDVVIPRNTSIPTSKSKTYTTAADNQPSVTVMVYQGEREFCKDNRLLGKFDLGGIAPAPRGVPQIEVSFDIDANGILNVKARDKATGKEAKIEIKGSSGLSKEEVERMTREAESHKADDKKRRELVDLKNQADQAAYQTERQMKDLGDKVPADQRAKIEGLVGRLKEAAKGEDAAAIRRVTDELNTALSAMGEQLYKSAAGAAAGAGPAGGTTNGQGAAKAGGKRTDDVIDAEYEVKDK
jgi:molecular chaperone DnaK